eukprot:Gb_26982 [translate_table: standard]
MEELPSLLLSGGRIHLFETLVVGFVGLTLHLGCSSQGGEPGSHKSWPTIKWFSVARLRENVVYHSNGVLAKKLAVLAIIDGAELRPSPFKTWVGEAQARAIGQVRHGKISNRKDK